MFILGGSRSEALSKAIEAIKAREDFTLMVKVVEGQAPAVMQKQLAAGYGVPVQGFTASSADKQCISNFIGTLTLDFMLIDFIEAFAAKASQYFAAPLFTVGGYNMPDGSYAVDFGFVTASKKHAIKALNDYGQLAAWDIKNNCEVWASSEPAQAPTLLGIQASNQVQFEISSALNEERKNPLPIVNYGFTPDSEVEEQRAFYVAVDLFLDRKDRGWNDFDRFIQEYPNGQTLLQKSNTLKKREIFDTINGAQPQVTQVIKPSISFIDRFLASKA